jgi:hypothetical protein
MNELHENRVGETHTNNNGDKLTILKYKGNFRYLIKFDDNTEINSVRYCHIKNGNVKNPNAPIAQGVGYLSIGKYNSKDHKLAHRKWSHMLERCYSEKYQIKKPSYIGCSVSEDWFNFQIFADWFYDETNGYKEGYELDKDILKKGNKIYSPETCCFIPPEINICFVKSNSRRGILPIGVRKNHNGFQARVSVNGYTKSVGTYPTQKQAFLVYKEKKESYIKNLADKNKDNILPKVYNALINYVVEITD